MRRALDTLYAAALVASALALVTIAVLVFVQIGGRILDRVILATGGTALGIQVPSLAEIGGFLFVGAAFLALPGTFRAAGHVRVTMLARALPPLLDRGLTVLVLAAALGLASFAAWHSWLQALDSWQFNSVSFGMIPIPLWLPQGVMTVGLAIFAVALLDELLTALRGGTPAFITAERARGIDEAGH
ncbi:TRAP transporter small permease [Roseibacterium sp. SDUM158016]|uniref:TRAP transporter small permease n=1 Tax=Roseicyclus sediminis TaxID=2980997 RepID=UPI0021D03890|nr:TRAP transporter small permease [Roseibacterium sp. SDUM158016]MCU4653232.1 TRAP transporter small permease [Roseibacterium sp. SDUM158016]